MVVGYCILQTCHLILSPVYSMRKTNRALTSALREIFIVQRISIVASSQSIKSLQSKTKVHILLS
jgi:hypothetical protein